MLFRSRRFRRSFNTIETVWREGYADIHSFMLLVAMIPRWLMLLLSSFA